MCPITCSMLVYWRDRSDLPFGDVDPPLAKAISSPFAAFATELGVVERGAIGCGLVAGAPEGDIPGPTPFPPKFMFARRLLSEPFDIFGEGPAPNPPRPPRPAPVPFMCDPFAFAPLGPMRRCTGDVTLGGKFCIEIGGGDAIFLGLGCLTAKSPLSC